MENKADRLIAKKQDQRNESVTLKIVKWECHNVFNGRK